MCTYTGKFGRIFRLMYGIERYYTVYCYIYIYIYIIYIYIYNNNKHVPMAMEGRLEGRNRK